MPKIVFFPYYGPNRRSDLQTIEIRLDFGPSEAEDFARQIPLVKQALSESGVPADCLAHFDDPLQDHPEASYASLLARTALTFQQVCGHRVDYHVTWREHDRRRCYALVEYEHPRVGMESVKLALSSFSGSDTSLVQAWGSFSAFARQHTLTVETRAIMRLARERGIPVFKVDQEPFAGHMKAGLGIRPNGALMLGHGAWTQVLDGTFCLSRCGARLQAMLKNPAQRKTLLEHLGLPTKAQGIGDRNARIFHLLVINRQVRALEELPGGNFVRAENLHDSYAGMALQISAQLGDVPAAISVGTADPGQTLARAGGFVRDFTLAPDLGRLLGGGSDDGLLDEVVGDLLDWLFPKPGAVRMPIIAVTGTNGKTTTSRMISKILAASGRRPGMVCTDGIFLDNKQISVGDASSFIGHVRVLTSTAVDVAVLETHHRGIAIRGFAFDHCEVGVCLNVTHEHLQQGEIETVEEMAAIKRALPERASGTAVLFADDEHCMAMLDSVKARRICLVSLVSGVARLRDMVDDGRGCFCVLEEIEEAHWIVLYGHEGRVPLLSVAQIPATFDGAARFNVSNAMHAAAAAYFGGADVASIAAGLRTFYADQSDSPGRMNVYDDLAFRVIIDFAHNPDGMKKVCEFVDLQEVPGRKLVAFAGMARRDEASNRKVAQTLVGHFDHYFCKDYESSEPVEPRSVSGFMRQVLIDEGVASESTTILRYGREDIYRIFDACQAGDLLVLLLGHVEKNTVPNYIKDYAARQAVTGVE